MYALWSFSCAAVSADSTNNFSIIITWYSLPVIKKRKFFENTYLIENNFKNIVFLGIIHILIDFNCNKKAKLWKKISSENKFWKKFQENH